MAVPVEGALLVGVLAGVVVEEVVVEEEEVKPVMKSNPILKINSAVLFHIIKADLYVPLGEFGSGVVSSISCFLASSTSSLPIWDPDPAPAGSSSGDLFVLSFSVESRRSL